ncbi:L-tyrosine/L-tryptophan isonitrile synthase family protein [candidate division WWE3 bacterium]|uniref:L-tyrosine/L-tryptophan isonitrile synthase family protein n=1 Tax=candidate division WWE3 bacterium TaxID=2053526 RepID=A0A955LGA6_UNCKA|nr:L-tyrosine/L-tryptophan isonitrile synthase family protein [candidate division WWE3 bacterium]
MTEQDYLKKFIFDKEPYMLTDHDRKTIEFEGMESFIFRKLTTAKYKASALPAGLEDKVTKIIRRCVAEEKPIHLTVPFGGYKKWQFASYPYPDWAEVFNISHLRNFLKPIAAAYKHGVILQYFSDEIFISRMNNYPEEDVLAYNESFQKLIHWYQSYFPPNLMLRFSKIRDEISQEKLMKRFDQTIETLREKWESVPPEDRALRLAKSARNYKGDLESLTPKEKEKILWESTLVHDAFIFGDWDKDVTWAFGDLMIPLGFRYTGSWGVHLKSSPSSTVQFWIGTGALKHRNDGSLVSTILTYDQFTKAQSNITMVPIELLPASLKNVSQIAVVGK